MVNEKIFKFFGVLFVFLGATIIFNSFQGITGFVVYDDIDLKQGYVIGVWFVLTGIVLAIYRKREEAIMNRKKY